MNENSKRLSVASISLMTCVIMAVPGCSNFTTPSGRDAAVFYPSYTIFNKEDSTVVSIPAPQPVPAARRNDTSERNEIMNRILKSQMVDLMLENQSLKEVVGILIDEDQPVDIVRNVGKQIEERDAQNNQLRFRIAELQRENGQLQETLLTLEARAAETQTQLAHLRERNKELEALQELTAGLQQKNDLLTTENRNLQNLLDTREQTSSDRAEIARLAGQIVELRADNQALRQSLAQPETPADDTISAVRADRPDSADLESLRDRTSELELSNRLLVSQNQRLRRMLVTQQEESSSSPPVALLSNRPDSGTAELQSPAVRIHALLPNPSGNENLNEAAILINEGDEVISMEHWMLRDPTGSTWVLDSLGSLRPGEQKTITRNDMSMSLNNTGDLVQLLDPQQTVRDSIAFGTLPEDQWIYFTDDRAEGLNLSLSRENQNP